MQCIMEVNASFARLSSPRSAVFSVTNCVKNPNPNRTNLSTRSSRHVPISASVERSFGSNTAVLPDSKVKTILDSVKWDDKGLAVAIAQNIDTGSILMQGFVNREALEKTIFSRKATFYSRSRSSLWTKGETSTNFINVHDIFLDCDRDSIIYVGKPDGPTCHTGAETCYYTSVYDILEGSKEDTEERLAKTTLYSLETTISRRKEEIETLPGGKPSWTKKLLLDPELLCSKVRLFALLLESRTSTLFFKEEAGELIQTLLDNEDKGRTASEMGDLLYHSMVLLNLRSVSIEEVLEVLRKRFFQSGVEEKNSRKKS